MSEQLTEEMIINRSMNAKKADNFYVSFLKLPENVSNILGRQIKSIQRPEIEIQYQSNFHKGMQRFDKQNLLFAPVSMVFTDDEAGLTSMLLYSHVMRQQNKLPDLYGREEVLDRDYRFDVKMQTFDSRDRMTEGYTLKSCFIVNLSHSEPMMASSESNEITVMLAYDNIDFDIVDGYYDLKDGLNF